MNLDAVNDFQKVIVIFTLIFAGSTFLIDNSIHSYVSAQIDDRVKLEPFMSQFITRYDPIKSDRVSVLEVLANYTVFDKSLLGSAVNAKLNIFASDGDSSAIKVSNYPKGFFLSEEGIITFNSVIDNPPDSVIANVFITDFEGTTKLSNTISLTEPFNDDEDQESILRIEDGRLAVLNEENENKD